MVALASPAWADLDQEIYHIQLKLNSIGFDVGEPDGVAGKRTMDAITKAAKSYGFEPDKKGFVDYFTFLSFDNRASLTAGPELEAIKSAVGGQLKDPFSAQFKDLFKFPSGRVCGMVNGKNAFGAYSGWTPFMAYAVELGGTFMPGVAFVDGETSIAFYHCLLDI